MHLTLLSPIGLVVCLAALLPLAGFVFSERRAAAIGARIGVVSGGSRRRRLEIAGALTVVSALLGLAAAQPSLGSSSKQRVDVDAQVLFVFDVTKSMAAASGPHQPTRLDRAKSVAIRVRSHLGGVQAGVASITQRVLPYLFPTADEGVFASTVREAVALDSPPPGAGTFAAVLNSPRGIVTDLSALSALAKDNYFLPRGRHRLAILFSDDESIPITADSVGLLAHLLPRIHVITVRVGDPTDRIFLRDGQPDPVFRADPTSAITAATIAHATRGQPFGENDADAIVRAARADLAGGRVENKEVTRTPRPLAAWVAAAALLPLAFLLRRRNL